MDRKKRIEGTDTALVASIYGLGAAVPTYQQFVQLYLNMETVLGRDGFYQSVAAMVGSGDGLPDGWIKAAISNPIEVSKWRRHDLKRNL